MSYEPRQRILACFGGSKFALTSFSAGLDLTEFYQKDRSQVTEFWRTVQDMWHTFYTTGLPVASCISGHCPAGGLIIASCSDYRVMQRGKFTIGLNEARLLLH